MLPRFCRCCGSHRSFHDLYEHLERARQTRAPEELGQLLDARLGRLQACGAPLPPRSAASRAALDKESAEVRGVRVSISDVHRELCVAISERFDIDELEALALLRTFLESEHRLLDALAPKSSDAFTEFLDAFTVFYFEEQLAVVRCIAALLRISEDAQNELYAMAVAVLDKFCDAAFATQVLAWFEDEAQRALPVHVRNDARYSLLWAKQGLCKQLALLEVVFLMYYGRLQPTCAFMNATLSAAKRTHFGQNQANSGFLDGPSSVLVDCVAHLLLFLAVECLSLEAALDPLGGESDAALAPLLADPDGLEGVLEILDGAGALVCYSPLLLGWALLLRRLEEYLETAENPRLQNATAVHDNGPPIWRRMAHGAMDPSMDLFGVLNALLASPLLGGAESAVLGASNLSALAYRAVFKGLLLSLTEIVQPEYIPDLDALVGLYAATFGASRDGLAQDAAEGVASLCFQFWTADMPHPTRASVLTTARRRFPASLRPLVRLAHALSGNAALDVFHTPQPGSAAAEASAAALDYLAQLPTLALILPGGPAGLAPYELVDAPGAGTVQYRVRRAMAVPATSIELPVGTKGTLISPLGSTPQVVLWQLAEPASAWRILRDVLALYVSPTPPRVSDEDLWHSAPAPRVDFLSPDCVPGDWEVVAEIADAFAAVLGADEGLAAALLEHLDGGGGLVAIALDMLRIALPLRPLPSAMICAAYRLLQVLLPLQPNEVWQRVRSSNVLIGSPGTIPLLASYASLRSADRETFSVLLADEVQRGRFPGTIALLDLVGGLVHELQTAVYADATELLAIKSQVLVRTVQWIADAIWPEYQHWTYAAPREQLEIGRRCVRIITALVEDPCAASGEPGLQPLAAYVDALLISACTPMRLRPLLTAIGSGHTAVGALYRAGHASDARLAEEVTEAYLHLSTLLLVRHRVHGTSPHPLATLFFQHTQVDGGAPGVRRELAGAVLQYIWSPMPPSVAIAAAYLATAVCGSVRRADAPVSFAGSLGSTHELDSAVKSLHGVLENTYGDEGLRVAVWRLLSALADSQPALATLLLTGGHRGEQANGTTALQLAVETAGVWSELWEIAPALLDAVVQFLGVAWGHAYEHPAVFAPLQSDAALWDALGALLARSTEPVPPTPASEAALDAPDASDAVCTYAHRVMAQARTLRLFQLTVTQKGAAEGTRVLRGLVRDAPQFARTLCTALASEVEAPAALEEHLAALVPGVPLAPLRRPPHYDDFDVSRTFGDAYVFVRDAYLLKLAGVVPEDDVRHDAAVLITSASLAWSMVDAQAARAAAWTDCLASSASRLDESAVKPCTDAALGLARQAADVPQDTPPAALVARLRLLSVLLAAGWARSSPASFPAMAALLASLLEHPAYAASERNELSAPLAELMLVTCAASRRTALDASGLASMAVVTQRTVHALAHVVAAAPHYAPSSADAHAASLELEVLGAALQHAIHLPRSAAVWAEPLRETRLVDGLVALVTKAPRAVSEEAWGVGHVLYLAPLLQLCATLAAERASCELLAQNGMVYALCSNALSAELEQGGLSATLSTGDANPLHLHWLLSLQIVTSLVASLTDAHAAVGSQFVESDADAFVQLYAPQLRRTLRFAPPQPPLALDPAQLHEVRAVLRLFCVMWRAKAAASPAAGTPAALARALPLGAELLERAPYVLQQLAYLYNHPRELRTLLGTDDDAIADTASAALRDCLCSLLGLLWDLGGASAVLLRDASEWPPLPALIQPTLHSAPGAPASLGTLLEAASALGDAARTGRDAQAAAALVQCIGLCATQAVVWARGKLPADAASCQEKAAQADAEIAAGLGRDIDAALRVAHSVCADERPLLRVLERFASEYLGARQE